MTNSSPSCSTDWSSIVASQRTATRRRLGLGTDHVALPSSDSGQRYVAWSIQRIAEERTPSLRAGSIEAAYSRQLAGFLASKTTGEAVYAHPAILGSRG